MEQYVGWAYDGINKSIPRNAGPECAGYLTMQRKLIEGGIIVSISLIALRWACKNIQPIPPVKETAHAPLHHSPCRTVLLIAMTFVFGVELGFKLASRSVIYVLNPCHITSMIQIYLLAARPSKWSTILFRIQLNYLNGPTLAYLFPETDSRTITLETSTYYIQHGLMFVIPAYLIRAGGAFNCEAVTDFTWNIISYGCLCLYHFFFLQILAEPFQVNLNHMLCPALLDPFEGPNYRWLAVIHQGLLCPILSKVYISLLAPKPNDSNNVNFKVIDNVHNAKIHMRSQERECADAVSGENGQHQRIVNENCQRFKRE